MSESENFGMYPLTPDPSITFLPLNGLRFMAWFIYPELIYKVSENSETTSSALIARTLTK